MDDFDLVKWISTDKKIMVFIFLARFYCLGDVRGYDVGGDFVGLRLLHLYQHTQDDDT